MKAEDRLKRVLAYELGETTSYLSCDIQTREQIDRMIKKIKKIYDGGHNEII